MSEDTQVNPVPSSQHTSYRGRNESVAYSEPIQGLSIDRTDEDEDNDNDRVNDTNTEASASLLLSSSSPSSTQSPSKPISTVPKIDANLLGRQHFYFGRTLGEGSYARVVHAKMKIDQSPDYAIKIMEKSFIQKEKKVKFVLTEKEILSIVNNPFIIKLHYTFQDAEYLYMCMDLAPGGELREVINREIDAQQGRGVKDAACDVVSTRFYIGELIEALEYLHKLNIVHMDIKPENILITSRGHIQIADFGTAMRNPEAHSSGSIFVGTAEYVSPEILNADTDELEFEEMDEPPPPQQRITRACDLWAVGCILYQMLCGSTPFSAETEYLIFVNINGHLDGSKPLAFPESITAEAKHLILSLLTKEPLQRLGARPAHGLDGASADSPTNNAAVETSSFSDEVAESYLELKNHPFFAGVPWGHWLETDGPYIPTPGPISEVLNDGANDDWMLEGEATPITKEFRANALGGHHEDDIEVVPLAAPASPATAKAKWLTFLERGESQIFTGLVSKRVGLFSKKRQLILTDTPRLLYVDPETMEKKGEIPWTKEYPVSLVVSRRHYHFTDCDGAGSLMWQELVGAMLEKQRDPDA